MPVRLDHIRNVAIIAHVDHGKTTLVDGLLRQGNVFRDNESVPELAMDKMDLERERGITIMAKNTAVSYGTTKINIMDTPGHADFGGEVERVLGVVDGVLLVVDAVDGPMPQTKFVLSKALALGLRAIVVVNKIDRPNARPDWVIDQTFDLFVNLNANDEQLDFPIVYASALQGVATLDASEPGVDFRPLFDKILEHVPAPAIDPEAPLQMLVTSIEYDAHRGRVAVGRVFNGTIRPNQQVVHFNRDGERQNGRVVTVFSFNGLRRQEVPVGEAGDIVAVTGFADVNVGETLADINDPKPLPATKVEEPTLRMTFGVNTSPLAGREGQFCTSPHLRTRLTRELETNVALRVEPTDSPDSWAVSGRGELHLAILIETMRREGYELQVSQPEVIFREIEGQLCEPFEMLTVEVPEEYLGSAVELLGRRRGEMQNMNYLPHGEVQVEFLIPTRGLIGIRTDLLTESKGTAIMNSIFAGYRPNAGPIQGARGGSLIATEAGVTTPFGLSNAEPRGKLFIGPVVEVYEGMIVGQHVRDGDLDVNVCKAKHLTNMRSSNADQGIRLTPAIEMSLDRALEYIGPDDLVEVTPKSVRMRKKTLDKTQRRRDVKHQEMAGVR
ncbi:MAG: GTP-binding protein TypA/BipA [Armatimonadetes bacterium]|jgi:GTP-binding protein|nr:GTP-binding protein TypA/BipA [Armatimonadota bacterium]